MKIKKKTLVLFILVILILMGLIVVVSKYLSVMYYESLVNEFIIQNLKSEYRETEISLMPVAAEYGISQFITQLGLYNWYNFNWEKDNIKFKVLCKPNLDIILVIEDNEISNVDLYLAYTKTAKYLLLSDKMDFECNLGVCIATWENKHLVVGKTEEQSIIIVLAQEIK